VQGTVVLGVDMSIQRALGLGSSSRSGVRSRWLAGCFMPMMAVTRLTVTEVATAPALYFFPFFFGSV